jgi:hypothetical protein
MGRRTAELSDAAKAGLSEPTAIPVDAVLGGRCSLQNTSRCFLPTSLSKYGRFTFSPQAQQYGMFISWAKPPNGQA